MPIVFALIPAALFPPLSSVKTPVPAPVPGETAPGHLKILVNTGKLIDELVHPASVAIQIAAHG